MKVDQDTKVFDILETYGDIAEVMETFGIKSVGKYSIRRVITRVLTVKWAARIHRVPLDKFLKMLNHAIESQSQSK